VVIAASKAAGQPTIKNSRRPWEGGGYFRSKCLRNKIMNVAKPIISDIASNTLMASPPFCSPDVWRLSLPPSATYDHWKYYTKKSTLKECFFCMQIQKKEAKKIVINQNLTNINSIYKWEYFISGFALCRVRIVSA
jgi:hypothetical protein